METQIESLWVFALLSKCRAFTSDNLISSLLLLTLSYASISLIYWVFPGGPSWGKYYLKKIPKSKLIPGPRGYPVFGSMNLMVNLAHRKLSSMAESCEGAKRLMAFSLGETRVIITCNPDVAKEILNSSVFADRPVKESAYSLMFNRAIGFAPYGVYWTTLRRISANHLFSPKQINGSSQQRFEIATQMVSVLKKNKNYDTICGVRDVLKRASLNHMMCSVFGKNYDMLGAASMNYEREELSLMVEQGYELLGKMNWSDHLPWLTGFDPQRIRFRCSKLVPQVNQFLKRIIDEHRAAAAAAAATTHQNNNGEKKKDRDFVDVLLSLQGPDKLKESDMIAVLWEMIFRGTDTVAVLIEWILARMVLHPDIQSKVHMELDKVIGKSRAVTESDISTMVYLPAVVKEVLRLHPPGPLLSWARLSITDTTVDGRHVPAGTTAMVNMWAITRDPEIWSEPLEFQPERFLQPGGADFSVFGSDLRLAPFGSGRRSCPGKALGLTTVTFWVATLLHEFEWKAVDQNPVDLSEVLRLSCEMVKPLSVKLRPRCT